MWNGDPSTDFKPLTSTISKCGTCGERLSFQGNDVPCVCPVCGRQPCCLKKLYW